MAKKKPNFKMRVVQEPKKRLKPTEAELEQVTFEAGGSSPEQKRRSLDKIRRDAKAYAPTLAYEIAYQKKVEDGTVTLEDIEEFGDYSHPLYQKMLRDNPNTLSDAQVEEQYERITRAENKMAKRKQALRKAAEAKARKK
tara:strand:- start:554 stop:973 length:420 start_codon:yes stop_codon:yes gene_type:complete